MSAKSFWNWVTNRMAAGTPDNASLFGFAPQPGTRLVTQAKSCTAAQIINAGGGGLDVGLRRSPILNLNNAQIIALPTVSQTLVAGVPNQWILPLVTILQWDFTAAPYTGANATFSILGPNFVGHANGFQGSVAILNQSNVNNASLTDFLAGSTVGAGVLLLSSPPLEWQGHIDLVTGFVQFGGVQLSASEAFDTPTLPGADWVLEFNNNGSGNLGGGDAANRLSAQMWYWQIAPLF
jgi:hypothetical protein